MTDLHQRKPLCFRAAEADDQWVRQQADAAGLSVNAFLARLVHEARTAAEQPQEISRVTDGELKLIAWGLDPAGRPYGGNPADAPSTAP